MDIRIYENQGFPHEVARANSWRQFADLSTDSWDEVYIIANNVHITEDMLIKEIYNLSIPENEKSDIVNSIRLDTISVI